MKRKKTRPKTRQKPKPEPVDEGWKYLRTFVGIKFNDREKARLWPAVKKQFVETNEKGKQVPKGYRPNLGTFIKAALWEKIERDARPQV